MRRVVVTRFWLLRLVTCALVVAWPPLAHAQSAWLPTDFGTLNNVNSRANAINGAGQVAGGTSNSQPQLAAFAAVWTRGGGATNLGALGLGGQSEAMGINAAGQVVGW